MTKKRTDAEQDRDSRDQGNAIIGMAKDIQYMKIDLAEIKQKMEADYITRAEFNAIVDPLKKIVYGMVGLILTAVVLALLALVVRK